MKFVKSNNAPQGNCKTCLEKYENYSQNYVNNMKKDNSKMRLDRNMVIV